MDGRERGRLELIADALCAQEVGFHACLPGASGGRVAPNRGLGGRVGDLVAPQQRVTWGENCTPEQPEAGGREGGGQRRGRGPTSRDVSSSCGHDGRVDAWARCGAR